MAKMDLTLKIQAKNPKKLIFLFKNKRTLINYKKYESLILKFESESDLLEVL